MGSLGPVGSHLHVIKKWVKEEDEENKKKENKEIEKITVTSKEICCANSVR